MWDGTIYLQKLKRKMPQYRAPKSWSGGTTFWNSDGLLASRDAAATNQQLPATTMHYIYWYNLMQQPFLRGKKKRKTTTNLVHPDPNQISKFRLRWIWAHQKFPEVYQIYILLKENYIMSHK